jgi:hypothetical protein
MGEAGILTALFDILGIKLRICTKITLFREFKEYKILQFFGLDFILLRKMNFVKKIWILILISMLFCSCKTLKYNNIKNGDLVFVTAQRKIYQVPLIV